MIVCKYKFDKSIYENLIPIFNDGYNGYTVTDEIDSENSNHIIRTIECDTLPTRIGFGYNTTNFTVTEIVAKSLLEVLDINANVTNMACMFSNCTNLTSLNVSNWDTSNVTNMYYMFYNCSNLTSLDVSNFDTSKVTNMACMFYNCKLLTSLNVSNWDTSKVTDMYYMFGYNINLQVLNLNNFIINDYTNIDVILNSANSLNKVYINIPDTLDKLVSHLPDRTEKESGKLVTSLRNKIPAETLTTLTTKNWEIVDLVAQYRYDANTYENLIPEFNAEFSSDKYEIYDSISEIVIDNIVWEKGSINGSGYNTTTDNTSALRTKYYYSVIPGIMYNFKFWTHYYWYDKDKNIISYSLTGTSDTKVTAPNNAKYVRLLRGSGSVSDTYNMVVSAKLITRSIESVNGDLPTLMRFGYKGNDTENHEYNGQGMSLLKIIDLNTKELTDCYRMFKYCKRVESINCSNWDTSKVTNMGSMFALFCQCDKLTSLDVSNFNTSNVTNMSGMFNGCNQLTSLDLSNFNTSKVTNIGYMFYNCSKLTLLDVSNWDTSKVTNMSFMFSGCKNLTSIDVSNFDTSKVTNIAYMFSGCSTLQTVGDLTNWNTKNLELCHALFYRCFKLKYAHIGGWNTSKVINVRSMFAGCESIEIIDMHNFDLKNAYNETGELFKYDMFQLKYLRINDLLGNDYAIDMIPSRTGKEQGVLISDAKLSEETLTKLQSKNWTIVSSNTLTKVAEYVYDSNTWRSMIPEFNSEFIDYFIDDVEDENGLVTRTISSMDGLPTKIRFSTCEPNGLGLDGREKALLELLYLNISNLTTEEQMFQGCINLIHVNTENMINLHQTNHMFCGCTNLTSLDVSNFDTSKVTNILYMFSGCQNLTSLDVSNWDTKNVTITAYMFQNCQNLTSLDVSNWDIKNVTNMKGIFEGCNNLTSLDVSNWDTKNVTNMDDIFNNTSLLKDIGMLYCSPSTINAIASKLPTTHTQTIWVKDIDINKLTSVSGVEFKEYKENSVMINLSSPLLNGDRIKVKDGKLCHYHKMGKVVLGYHDGWNYGRPNSGWNQNGDAKAYFIMDTHNVVPNKKINGYCYTEKIKTFKGSWIVTNTFNENCMSMGHINYIIIRTTDKSVGENNNSGFKQWLSENPITVIYELAQPYYEDITPLQSDIVLETYLECNMDICTDLPIKTNVSYITNVPSLSTLSMRATEMKESDNIIANLTNMLDNEINE